MNRQLKNLGGRHILLGITGGIAAYKSADLVRRLREHGAQVQVVMTHAATEFVTPLTFQALSGNPVHTELLDDRAEAGMGHIELARWADAVLIAPASANTIARIAQGRGDDLLTTLVLATEAPVCFAPSMNRVMWADKATQENCALLRTRGMMQFGPATGEQACGEVGEGRMLEVADLVGSLAATFSSGVLQGVSMMITAGPTYEAIDPVRFIGNRSSGRMGFELARAASDAGAEVTLIAGPVSLETPEDVTRIDVESAAQMHAAVMDGIRSQQLFIATAAVADYRPETVADNKIKKSADEMQIRLIRNPDILAEVAALDNAPFTVGFAAETDKLRQYALDKLNDKRLDMIAANRVGGDDSGFDSEFNELLVMWPQGEQRIPHARKSSIAKQLVNIIAQRFNQRSGIKEQTA